MCLHLNGNQTSRSHKTNQPDLDKLSTKQIKKLWKDTTDKARGIQAKNAAAAAAAALTDVTGDDGDEYYLDGFGNVVPGRRPPTKTVRTYVDASGYVQELAEGQEAPQLSGSGLVDWLNRQDISADPELREALGADNLFLTDEQIRIGDDDVSLNGRLESDGWHVVSSGSTQVANLKFRLGRSLTREQAIEQAVGYIESKSGPRYKQLTDNERRMCERMAVTDRASAFVFYIQARLPVYLADEFLRLGATGDALAIQRFGADKTISEIAEEACAHVFYWNNPSADEDFFEYARANDGGRTWTFPLFDFFWTHYQTRSAINHLNPSEPTAEEILADAENMTDEELAATLTEARRLRSNGGAR